MCTPLHYSRQTQLDQTQYVLALVVNKGNRYVESFVLYDCSASQLRQARIGWVLGKPSKLKKTRTLAQQAGRVPE